MAFQILTSAFADGGWIPDLHTCQGADISPSLEWRGEPADTRSFVLILDDPDAPGGTWNHWLLYDIPSKLQDLAQGAKAGSLGLDGINDFGKKGYGGPCPPKGHGPHRYFFHLYSVDVPTLGIPAGVKRAELDRAMKGHLLAETHTMGRFERK